MAKTICLPDDATVSNIDTLYYALEQQDFTHLGAVELIRKQLFADVQQAYQLGLEDGKSHILIDGHQVGAAIRREIRKAVQDENDG